jgi:hypothetical protein
MSLRAIYSELRALRKELARERALRNQTLIHGTIEEGKGDRVKVRLMDAGADGKPVFTPFIRLAAHTGKRGSGVSEFTKYGVGEPVLVVSPNGKLGTMSAAMPWISSEDDPAPGKAEEDGKIITIGAAKLEVRGDYIQASVGSDSRTTIWDGEIIHRVSGAQVRLRPNAINIVLGGSEIIVTSAVILIKSGDVVVQSGSLTHNGKNVGATHTNEGLKVD